MTIAARINLQKGIPENQMDEWTNYSIESPLDAYLVQKQRIKDSYKAQQREAQQQAALEDYVTKMVEEKLEGCLEKALDEVLKGFN